MSSQAKSTPEAGPATLRAIAHPVRLRLYEALVAGGPSTNTRLAQEVPGAPGSLSYHLRQLEAHGFVEEAPELAKDQRERWWRAVPGGVHWSEADLEDSPGTREAAATAHEVLLGRRIERIRTWVRQSPTAWSAEWREAAVDTDAIAHLSVEQLAEMGQELQSVIQKYTALSTGPAAEAEEGAESVFVSIHAFPFRHAQDDPSTSDVEDDQ